MSGFREWLAAKESMTISPPATFKPANPARPVAADGPMGTVKPTKIVKPLQSRRSGVVGGPFFMKKK